MLSRNNSFGPAKKIEHGRVGERLLCQLPTFCSLLVQSEGKKKGRALCWPSFFFVVKRAVINRTASIDTKQFFNLS